MCDPMPDDAPTTPPRAAVLGEDQVEVDGLALRLVVLGRRR